jgi:hypothetical protein
MRNAICRLALSVLFLALWPGLCSADETPAAAEAAAPEAAVAAEGDSAPATAPDAVEPDAAEPAPAEPDQPAAPAPADDAAAPAEKPPPRASQDPPRAKLPTFAAGPWQGCYAVYEHANFTATMDDDGVLSVQLKNNREPTGAPLTFGNLGVHYTVPGIRPRTYGRYPIEYENPGEPLLQPKKIVLKGKLRHGVAFTRTIEFQGNTILACAGFKDPPRIEHPSAGQMGISFPRSHDIANHIEQPERERLLAGCVLTTKERVAGKAKRSEHSYAKRFAFGGFLEEAVARGPWGPRVVRVDSRNLRKQHMAGWVYPDMCPWEGYRIHVGLPEGDLSPAFRVILTID